MEKPQKERLRELLFFSKGLQGSMDASLRADSENVWKYATYMHFARRYNDLAKAVSQTIQVDAPLLLFDLSKMKGSTDTLAIQQKEIFESAHVELSILIAYLENKLNVEEDDVQNLKNFFQANFRRSVYVKPNLEVDIQNSVENLLIGRGLSKGLDYDRERGRVKMSSKEVVPDFIFPRLGLALEVKLLREPGKIGSLIDQINADIRAYSKSYPYIFFLIYDLSGIRDEDEFRSDLENAKGVSVLVIKH